MDNWIKTLSNQKDWLYDKLANPEEGWTIKFEESSFDVPLNELDATAYRILQKAILHKKKIAIALPRVKIGVSLSIIAYLVVNRFLKQKNSQLANFTPVQLNNDQALVVATRNRKLRDFFMESFLRFSNVDFPFTQFPIYRLNRLGNIIPLFGKSAIASQLHLEPVVFYHFDETQNVPDNLKKSCVIGELVETDSRYLTERLCNFIESLQSESALIFINEYSSSTISKLKENGFEIIAITNDVVNGLEFPDKVHSLPSLAGSLANCPDKTELRIQIVEDDFASLRLGRIAKILSKLNRKLTGEKPLIVLRAWSIFYNLKDLSVSLEKLEQSRKSDLRLKSLKFSIDQIFNTPISNLNPELQEIFRPMWSSLEVEINDLYSHLLKNSKKADLLNSIVKSSLESKEVKYIVFPSNIEAQIFKENLIIEYGWIENESNIKVDSIDSLINTSQVCEHIILQGIWRKVSQAKILSLLPKTITVICYTTELVSIAKTVRELNSGYIQNLKSGTAEGIQKLGMTIPTINYSIINLLQPESESQILIDHYKELVPKDLELSNDENESLDWLDGEQENIENLEVDELGASIQTNEEEIQVYQISLSDGKEILIPVDQNIFAYSEDLNKLESKLPESLAVGDVMLLYTEEQNNEMFRTALQRTQELSKADPRIINIWKVAQKELREWYDVNSPGSFHAYLQDLEELGCDKPRGTVKNWLKGLTLAPNDNKDIECLLLLIKYKNASVMARLISSEIEKTRIFNRELGKRLHARLENALSDSESREARDIIDKEIDELLESADIVTITEISNEAKFVSKDKVITNIFG